jgi:hypothetical protein
LQNLFQVSNKAPRDIPAVRAESDLLAFQTYAPNWKPKQKVSRVPSVLHSLTAIHTLRPACLPVSLSVCTVRTTYLRATGAKTEKNASITERARLQHENRLRCANTNRSSRAVGAQVRILIHEFVLRGV